MVLRFTHRGNPIHFNRPRFNGKRGFNTKRYADYKKSVVGSVRFAMSQAVDLAFPILGDIKLYMNFTRGDRRGVDIDNLIKAIMDALQDAGVFKNDSQVTRVYATKSVSKNFPGVSVIVREVGT